MFNVKINNYRGIKSAEVRMEIGYPAIVMAQNGAGKTTICQGVGSVIAKNPVPIHGMKKNAAQMLVRVGVINGSIHATFDDGSEWSAALPACTAKGEGPLLAVPEIADVIAGRRGFFDLDEKEQAVILNNALGVLPSKEDWDAATIRHQITEKVRDTIWATILTVGWDEAHKRATEKGSQLKGQWSQISRENYGAKKSRDWIPQGWGPDLMGATEESLATLISEANEELEAALREQGADESEYDRLLELAKAVPVRKDDLEDAEARLEMARNAFLQSQDELDKMPAPGAAPNCSCPACKAPLIMQGRSLMVAEAANPEAAALRREKEAVVADLKAKMDNAAVESGRASAAYIEAYNAATQIQGMQEPARNGGSRVSGAREILDVAKTRLDAFKAKRDADRIVASLDQNQLICDLLSREGIRKDCLAKRIGTFNEKLLKRLGFGYTVAIGTDLQVTLDELPYQLLSKSQQWVCAAAMQIALAIASKSKAVVLDAADMLDSSVLSEMLKVVRTLPICVLIGITVDDEGEFTGRRVMTAIDGDVARIRLYKIVNKDKRSGVSEVLYGG